MQTFFIRPVFQGFTPCYVIALYKNKIFIHHYYENERLSAKQIAQEIFSSKMAVLNALVRFGIPIREPHHHHGHPSQPRYGRKFSSDRLVNFKIEQRVIRIIHELDQKGFSLRQIAKMLNEMKIVTKCKSQGWHPEMVRRVLS